MLKVEKVTFENLVLNIVDVEKFSNHRTTYTHSAINAVNAEQVLIDQSKFISTETNFFLQFSAKLLDATISNTTAARTFTITQTVFTGNDVTKLSLVQHVPTSTTLTAIYTVEFINLLISGTQVEVFIDQPLHTLNMSVINCEVANSSQSGLEIIKNRDTDMYVWITNSIFVGNRLGLSVIGNTAATILSLTIEDTKFLQNEKSGLFKLGSGQSLLLRNTSFIDNVETLPNSLAKRYDLVDLQIRGPTIATVDSCLFNGYVGVSSVLATDAQLYFLGNTIFSNNVGISGGALEQFHDTGTTRADTIHIHI